MQRMFSSQDFVLYFVSSHDFANKYICHETWPYCRSILWRKLILVIKVCNEILFLVMTRPSWGAKKKRGKRARAQLQILEKLEPEIPNCVEMGKVEGENSVVLAWWWMKVMVTWGYAWIAVEGFLFDFYFN